MVSRTFVILLCSVVRLREASNNMVAAAPMPETQGGGWFPTSMSHSRWPHGQPCATTHRHTLRVPGQGGPMNIIPLVPLAAATLCPLQRLSASPPVKLDELLLQL